MTYTPIEVAIALSLYNYNVSPQQRAQAIYNHFKGHCAEMVDLERILVKPGYAPTELAFPSAKVYVQHALGMYGVEARQRVEANDF